MDTNDPQTEGETRPSGARVGRGRLVLIEVTLIEPQLFGPDKVWARESTVLDVKDDTRDLVRRVMDAAKWAAEL